MIRTQDALNCRVFPGGSAGSLGYAVLASFGSGRSDDQPLYDRLWRAGFLPTKHQGVRFRNSGDPVLYVADPAGIDRQMRRSTLDRIARLNAARSTVIGAPDIAARTSQSEMPCPSWASSISC